MNPAEFISKWRKVELTERSAAQQHFIDLCALVEHPTPAEVDRTGDTFTFERGAAKQDGGDGWADVWKRGFFAIEYKGKHKDLDAAYRQLLQYREDLENPPLLVTCDLDRIIIRTNFTATPTRKIEIELDNIGMPDSIEALRAMFHDPQKLKPGVTSTAITTKAASHIADLAQVLRDRGLDPHQVALFLDRIVFCLFAEDIDLLPKGLFSDIVAKTRTEPERFAKLVAQLFDAMAHGGDFGAAVIRHFNGNLFTDTSVLALTRDDLDHIHEVASLDWSAIDPSIFGTLFVRGMDPAKRSQLGAEYTSRTDIETIVEPVVFNPLRREWAALQDTLRTLLATGKKTAPNAAASPFGKGGATPGVVGDFSAVPAALSPALARKAHAEADSIVHQFLTKLAGIKILDPACGSGNFLYVTLQKLKDLEKEVILFVMDNGLGGFLPQVGPWQLYGIEIDRYAFDLAQMTVWIGYLQWTKANGFGITQEPILRLMEGNFKCMDAILDLSDPAHPREPEWPQVDYIVGNPPFLGNRIMPKQLGVPYVMSLSQVYQERLGGKPDLCCYWFEKARIHIEEGKCLRAGLLATQGIRGGTNRNVIKRIKESGDIFFAESDRPWILDGANVHVSLIGFDNGDEQVRTLDGMPTASINANLTMAADTTVARKLEECADISYQGTIKRGSFDIEEKIAISLLHAGGNPTGRPNSDVIFPYVNGLDVTRRNRSIWIIDFGSRLQTEAAGYEQPFKMIENVVQPERAKANQANARDEWWLHWCTRPNMVAALSPLPRFMVTANVSKYRLFSWQMAPSNSDHQLIVFTRDDDYFFGVLHSRLHEVWALKLGTRLETRPRYTPTTCFETFPLPFPPGKEPLNDPHMTAIAAAAKELDGLRTKWLNPPEWTQEAVLEFLGTVGGPWTRYIDLPADKATPGSIGTVHYARLVPKNAECATKLAKRTLTNLYNERPTWLAMAHAKLDQAVFAAYDWSADLTDQQILERLLALNKERA